MGNLYEVNITTGDITTDGTLTAAGVLTTTSGVSPIGSSSSPYGLAYISPVLPNYESVSGTNQRGLTAIDDSHRVLTNDGTSWGLDSFIRRIIKENANGGTRVLTAKDAGVMRIVDCTNFNQIYTLPVSSSLGSNGAFFGFCKQDPTSNSIELSFASALDNVGGFTKRYLKLDGDHIILGSNGGEYFIISNGNSLPDQLFRPHRTPVFSEGQFPYNVNVSSDRGAIIRCVADTGEGTVNLPSAADFDSIKTNESPPYVNTYTLCIQRTNSSNYPVNITPATGTNLNGSSNSVTLTRDWESIIIDWDSTEWSIINYTRGGAFNDTASVFGSGFNTASSGTLGEITISGGLGSLVVEGAVPYRKGNSTGSESNFTYDEVLNQLNVDNALFAGSITTSAPSNMAGVNSNTISGTIIQAGSGNMSILSGYLDLVNATVGAATVQHVGRAANGAVVINTIAGTDLRFRVGGTTYASVATTNPTVTAGGFFGCATITGTTGQFAGTLSTQSLSVSTSAIVPTPTAANHAATKAYVDANARTFLTTSTTFYVATSGNDSTGDGTESSPWATPIGAFNNLLNGYDLDGNIVTVQVQDGTYTNTNQFAGLLPGQRGYSYLLFRGNYSNPANCLIKPTTGYAFSVEQGAQCTIGGFKMDMADADSGAGQDTTAIGDGAIMVWDNKLIFGFNRNPWNHASVNGTLRINAGPVGTPNSYKIEPSFVNTTWSGAANTTTLFVTNASGIKQYMGVNGSFMDDDPAAYVVAVSGTTVTINTPTSNGAPVSGQSVNFVGGAQCHIDVGQAGRCVYITNGELTRMDVECVNLAFFFNSFVLANQLSVIDAQGINFTNGAGGDAQATGKRYDVRSNSIIDINIAGAVPALPNSGETYFPGTVSGTRVTGGQYV